MTSHGVAGWVTLDTVLWHALLCLCSNTGFWRWVKKECSWSWGSPALPCGENMIMNILKQTSFPWSLCPCLAKASLVSTVLNKVWCG